MASFMVALMDPPSAPGWARRLDLFSLLGKQFYQRKYFLSFVSGNGNATQIKCLLILRRASSLSVAPRGRNSGMGGVQSKYWAPLPYTCYEVGHTWEASCTGSTVEVGLTSLYESAKIYASVYAVRSEEGGGY